ncbi:MAG: hypothetical protein ACM3ME_10405 [Chloroflexota bacterium]
MMKKLTLLICLIIPAMGFGQKNPQFNIECKENGELTKVYGDGFERIVEYYLDDQFSCCKTVTKGDIIGKLAYDKMMQLSMGTDMMSYCKELACDYYMILYLEEGMGKTFATASCYRWKGKEPLSRLTYYQPEGGDIVGLMKQVGQDIAKALAKYEICAFEGPVNFEVTSTKDTTITEERSVYCNGIDNTYKKVSKVSGTSHSVWELQKKDKEHAEGNVSFTINESGSVNEDDGCHKCSTSEREGGWSFNSSLKLDYSSSGLSEESKLDGEVHVDARIILDFRSDDTYTITIKATTKLYPAVEQGYMEAVGTCDGIPRKLIDNTRNVSAFAYPRFGPYKGKATDRTLSMKDSITYYEPQTHEKTTITIDYTLTRN